MIIREGMANDVQHFVLWNEANDGAQITVAEEDGVVVAFAQHSGTTIYMIESAQTGRGYARALVSHILHGADYAAADNVSDGCAGFWGRMGFAPEGRNSYGQSVWTWYPEEDE